VDGFAGYLSTIGGFSSLIFMVAGVMIGPFQDMMFKSSLSKNLFTQEKSHLNSDHENDIE
jgi:hypothetical protein